MLSPRCATPSEEDTHQQTHMSFLFLQNFGAAHIFKIDVLRNVDSLRGRKKDRDRGSEKGDLGELLKSNEFIEEDIWRNVLCQHISNVCLPKTKIGRMIPMNICFKDSSPHYGQQRRVSLQTQRFVLNK